MQFENTGNIIFDMHVINGNKQQCVTKIEFYYKDEMYIAAKAPLENFEVNKSIKIKSFFFRWFTVCPDQ